MRRAFGAAFALVLVAAGRAEAQGPLPQAGAVPAYPPPSAEGALEALDFWQALGDTTLARLTRDALRANRDVHVAEARVRRARAARLDAALDLAPAVTVAGGYTRQRLSEASFGLAIPDRGLWDAEVRASWEVDVFGRVRRQVRGQNLLAESAREDVREMERVVASEVAVAYFELRGAQGRLDVARRNAENQRRTLQLTRNRLDAGRGTAFDIERAQAQVSATLALIPTLEARVAAVQHRIGVLVGRDPKTIVPELADAGGLPRLPKRLPLDQAEARIRARPDVLAAERRLAAESAFVGSAKAGYLPQFHLAGTAGLTSTEFDGLGKSGTSRYAMGPVVTWPALNLGRVKAGVDAARSLEAEARARYEQSVLLAAEELENAQVAYDRARERVALLMEAAEASSRAAELARVRFEGGVADFLQVLDAERSLLSAQDQLAQGETDVVTAMVAVYRALGGPEPLSR